MHGVPIYRIRDKHVRLFFCDHVMEAEESVGPSLSTRSQDMGVGFVSVLFLVGLGTLPPLAPRTPLGLTATRFSATAATARAPSSWGTARSLAPQPESTRSLVFWGNWLRPPACAGPSPANATWGFTAARPSATPLGPLDGGIAFLPACGGAAGPSFEADLVVEDGADAATTVVAHLVRTVADPSAGPFTVYGPAGQNPSGANAHIAAAYVDLNPKWEASVPARMRPWGLGTGPGGPDLRMVIAANQSVTAVGLPDPARQQLQQVIDVTLINEGCDERTSPSFCQISLNLKTLVAGVHATGPGSDAVAFNDGGQGGLVVLVGNVNAAGLATSFVDPRGARRTAWTSRGAATQAAAFGWSGFEVEMSWPQFLGVLAGVTRGDPTPVFGPGWNNRSAWVLLRAGWGQENFNNGTSTSTVEGLFQSLNVTSINASTNTSTASGPPSLPRQPNPGEASAPVLPAPPARAPPPSSLPILAPWGPESAPMLPSRPNILFLLVDDLGVRGITCSPSPLGSTAWLW